MTHDEYNERCAEALGELRHDLKMALGKYCDKHADNPYADDEVIVAAVASLLCELLIETGAAIDDDLIHRLRGTYAVIKATHALENARYN